MNKTKRTITISLRNWQRLSRLKIRQGLKGFDELISYMFDKIKIEKEHTKIYK